MPEKRPIRWWPAPVILSIALITWLIVRSIEAWSFEQMRSIALIAVFLGAPFLLLIWWLFFSRLGGRTRIAGVLFAAIAAVLFRFVGMTGDFVPIIKFRFGSTAAKFASTDNARRIPATDYPQLFGPARDCVLPGPSIDLDWKANPPHLVWKQPIGAAWSGFAVVGGRAVTMEQHGDDECTTCYEPTTGRLLWKTPTPGVYDTKIAGRGPRATPTIADRRVFTFGAVGTLSCLDLETGKVIWSRNPASEAGQSVPDWGFSSSPLVHGGLVIVSVGGPKSLVAFRVADGAPAWHGGTQPVSYSSPFLLTAAGRQVIMMFNHHAATAHDPTTGAVLWEQPWGKGFPHVSRPIPIAPDRILFSSGYGVGAALFALKTDAGGAITTDRIWNTPRFQAKFSNPVERDGFVYGVSDGIFACLDLADGKVRWKDGRYGHGQGLLIGDSYLQMTEQPGELVLLQPTPDAANERARFPVFDDKTWNPIALSGDLLLIRNDREAACVRLPIRK